MSKLNISPDINGYSLGFKSKTVASELQYGQLRQRQDYNENSILINCKWTLNQSEYIQLISFFTTNQGVDFLIDLLLLEGGISEYTANLIPDSLNLNSQQGDVFVVAASLEVLPDLTTIDWQIELVSIRTYLENPAPVLIELINLITLFGNARSFKI